MIETVKIAIPAAPLANATLTLFDTTAAVGWAHGAGQMRALNVSRITLVLLRTSHGSAASGFHAYGSSDKGTNMDELAFADSAGTATMPRTISAATTAEAIHEFLVGHLDDFKLTFVNGASNQTTWRGYLILTLGETGTTEE